MQLANQIAGVFKMQYLKRELNDEVCFWHADKHQSFLQGDAITMGVHSQGYLKYQVLTE